MLRTLIQATKILKREFFRTESKKGFYKVLNTIGNFLMFKRFYSVFF